MPVIQNPADKTRVAIDLPTEVYDMVVRGLASQAQWTEKIRDQQTGLEVANPVTKKEAARAVLISFVSQVVKQDMINSANKAATQASNDSHSAIMKEINEGGLITFENL